MEMWAVEFTGTLLESSFTQSVTDRRLFHLTDKGGLLLIVGTFVDDSKAVVQSEFKAAEFSLSLRGEVPRPSRRRGDRS